MDLKHGSFGENILFDFDPHNLHVGNIISLGEAQLEIREKCTICNHLSIFGPKLPKLIKNHRGIYCKILKSGRVEKKLVAYKE
jgi:MOSC domain-containing protein YiiM